MKETIIYCQQGQLLCLHLQIKQRPCVQLSTGPWSSVPLNHDLGPWHGLAATLHFSPEAAAWEQQASPLPQGTYLRVKTSPLNNA